MGLCSFCFFVLSTVPDDPPYNLSYRILNSTSIKLFYSPPSSPNGIIKYYTITCLGVAADAMHYNSSIQSVIISDLKKYSEYNITASASTYVGPGPRTSRLLFVRTGEDGKLFLFF